MSQYPQVPGSKSDGTSSAAAIKTKPRAATLRDQALSILKRNGRGMTADEIASCMGESILSIRPRISELYSMGLVRRTGERRTNTSGQQAHVFIVNEEVSA